MQADILPLVVAAPGITLNVLGGPDRASPLHYAAAFLPVESSELLIKAGADVNILSLEGATPLIEAASSGDDECVRLFLENGADIMTVCPDRGTALEAAIEQGDEDCIELLTNRAVIILRALKMAADGGNTTALEVIASERDSRKERMVAEAAKKKEAAAEREAVESDGEEHETDNEEDTKMEDVEMENANTKPAKVDNPATEARKINTDEGKESEGGAAKTEGPKVEAEEPELANRMGNLTLGRTNCDDKDGNRGPREGIHKEGYISLNKRAYGHAWDQSDGNSGGNGTDENDSHEDDMEGDENHTTDDEEDHSRGLNRDGDPRYTDYHEKESEQGDCSDGGGYENDGETLEEGS